MSKCREAYAAYCAAIYPRISMLYEDWQDAWNAATQNAVEICEGQITGVNPVGDMAREDCAEAIEREQCE